MNWLKILENSYEICKETECPPRSKMEYLSEYIFDFTTYDSNMAEFFAEKAIAVCEAISNKKTFEFIENEDNYKWYLVMCNMPFFAEKIDWGTSIRGAWWRYSGNKFESNGLFDGFVQMTGVIEFAHEEWTLFVDDLIKFSRK